MKKILLVIRREYLTRVKKPSFWVLTIVVPILLAALYAIPLWLANKPLATSHLLVVDDTGLFVGNFRSSDDIVYDDASSLDQARHRLQEHEVDAVVYIPARETTIPGDAFLYFRTDAPGLNVQSDVDNQLQNILRNNILLDVHGVSPEDYNLITNTRIKLRAQDIETGRDGYLKIKALIGALLAMLVFVTIFMFGSQVMRGVMEEKTNRIVEVIVSSLRPFQLMMGKVVGIAAVGLTQLMLWMLLSGVALTAVHLGNADLFERAAQQQVTQIATKGEAATAQMQAAAEASPVPELVQALASINFGVLAGTFVFYFLVGYLLYASLFAAVGAVSDNETDNQQFTLPLTLPLLITFMLVPQMLNEPAGSLATWLSIIPFTSPVAMMFRIPFGVPYGQVVLSAVLLLVSFPVCTWVAAKVYRAGILLYGKKITYRQLWKWIKQ